MDDEKIHVLLVDDDEVDREAVIRLAKDQFEIVQAESVARAEEVLQDFEPECILLDYRLPDASDLEHLTRFSEMGYPVIMLTGQGGERIAVDAMKAGAKDYLPKAELSNEALKRSITNAIKTSNLEAELEKAREELIQMATVDGLTNLNNRRYFDDQLDHEILMINRTGLPLSLCILDIDHFKAVNDTHGHLAGDEVLKEIASALKARARKSDTVCRYGGEEFAILLPATTTNEAKGFCEIVRETIKEVTVQYESTSLSVTVSIGVSTANSQNAIEGSELIRRADKSLYKAKELGRDQVVAEEYSDTNKIATG